MTSFATPLLSTPRGDMRLGPGSGSGVGKKIVFVRFEDGGDFRKLVLYEGMHDAAVLHCLRVAAGLGSGDEFLLLDDEQGMVPVSAALPQGLRLTVRLVEERRNGVNKARPSSGALAAAAGPAAGLSAAEASSTALHSAGTAAGETSPHAAAEAAAEAAAAAAWAVGSAFSLPTVSTGYGRMISGGFARARPSRLEEEYSPVTEAVLHSIFEKCDTNSDGHINKRELVLGIRRDATVAAFFGLPEVIRQEDGSRDQMEQIFQSLDKNDDREISWAEFRRWFFERDVEGMSTPYLISPYGYARRGLPRLALTGLSGDSPVSRSAAINTVEHMMDNTEAMKNFSKISNYLANERTLLAWTRTSVALVRTVLATAALAASTQGWEFVLDLVTVSLSFLSVAFFAVGCVRFIDVRKALNEDKPPLYMLARFAEIRRRLTDPSRLTPVHVLLGVTVGVVTFGASLKGFHR